METVKLYEYQELFRSCKFTSNSNLNQKKEENYKLKILYKNFEYVKSI